MQHIRIDSTSQWSLQMQVVERAVYSIAALVEYVGINHRRFHVIVPEQLLYCPDVRT